MGMDGVNITHPFYYTIFRQLNQIGRIPRDGGPVKTIKQLAEELNVTPQAVRDEVRRQGIQTNKADDKVNGKAKQSITLLDDDADRIIKAFLERRDAKQSKKNDDAKQSEKTLFAALQSQIEEKNRQIEELKEENRKLLDALETAQALARDAQEIATRAQGMAQAAQALHAGTMHQIEQHNDRRWWQFWKKKD